VKYAGSGISMSVLPWYMGLSCWTGWRTILGLGTTHPQSLSGR
jgi:hypothetical protein